MIRAPPELTRTSTPFPYTSLFRSAAFVSHPGLWTAGPFIEALLPRLSESSGWRPVATEGRRDGSSHAVLSPRGTTAAPIPLAALWSEKGHAAMLDRGDRGARGPTMARFPALCRCRSTRTADRRAPTRDGCHGQRGHIP